MALVDAILSNLVDPRLLQLFAQAGPPSQLGQQQMQQELNQSIADTLAPKDVKQAVDVVERLSQPSSFEETPAPISPVATELTLMPGVVGALPTSVPVNPAANLGTVAQRAPAEFTRPTNLGVQQVGERGSAAAAAPGGAELAGAALTGYTAAAISDQLGQKVLNADLGDTSAVLPTVSVVLSLGNVAMLPGYFAYEAFRPVSAQTKFLNELKDRVTFAMGSEFNKVYRDLPEDTAKYLSSNPGLDLSSETFFNEMVFEEDPSSFFEDLRNRVENISRVRENVEHFGKIIKMRAVGEGKQFTDDVIQDADIKRIRSETQEALDTVDNLEALSSQLKSGGFALTRGGLDPRIIFTREIEKLRPAIEKSFKYFYLAPPQRSVQDADTFVYTVPVFDTQFRGALGAPVIDFDLWRQSQNKNLSGADWHNLIKSRQISGAGNEEERKALQFGGPEFSIGFYNPSISLFAENQPIIGGVVNA